MKSIKEIKQSLQEEKQDYAKFDALVRAGLANKAQLQRLHKILEKMGEERPNFSNADKEIVRNMFNKMVDLLSNNPQLNRQARKAITESSVETDDFKVDKLGRKHKAHRVKVGDEPVEEIKESVVKEPPFVLVLKRTVIRTLPNNTKVALYHNDKLNKDFAIPFSPVDVGMIQSEEVEHLDEAVMDTLHKIVDGKSSQKVKFGTGETRTVDHFTASAITQVHKALNDDNKKKFSDMVHKSPAHFQKAADFAFSKTK